jgi:ABC-2 type transport system ATP-binding protein
LLAQLALPESRKLSQLSRGMLMKAALLSSLAYRPKLLVLDEPFSGLDPLVRDEFIKGMLEVTAAGEWTVLVSSHDIDEVERLADRVAMLEGGRLKLSEATEALQARFRRVEVTGAASTFSPGADWLDWEQAGALTKFVETRYAGETTERLWRERFGSDRVTAQAMTLREIFLTFARAERAAARKESA